MPSALSRRTPSPKPDSELAMPFALVGGFVRSCVCLLYEQLLKRANYSVHIRAPFLRVLRRPCLAIVIRNCQVRYMPKIFRKLVAVALFYFVLVQPSKIKIECAVRKYTEQGSLCDSLESRTVRSSAAARAPADIDPFCFAEIVKCSHCH